MSNFHAIPRRTKVHSHYFKLNDEVWIMDIYRLDHPG
jgi:hypothetical protein